MVIKLVHISAYVIHFIIGLFSSLMSVWGLGFLLAVITLDALTIIISGTHGVATVISMYKQNMISKGMAIACGILSYVYCADVVVAIY